MNFIYVSVLSAVWLCAASLSAAGEIDVMTQNQYIGADLNIGANATNPEAANQAIIDMLTAIAHSRPAERVRALAAEIAHRHPDVVGLQEAFAFICEGPGCEAPAIKDAFVDHLQNTEEALRGTYAPPWKVTNLQVGPIPFYVQGYGPATLRIEDRDAILVRTGLEATKVTFADDICQHSDDGCNYRAAFPVPVPPPAPPIVIKRGFLAIDVTIQGRGYRVFTTHLEQERVVPAFCETQLYQVLQAYELLNTILNTSQFKTVILVGDINSAPSDTIACPGIQPVPPLPGMPPIIPPYQIFTSRFGIFPGFLDTWTVVPHADSGFTCCQDPSLLNQQSELTQRIDMIFSLPAPSQVVDMKLLGNTMGDKTVPPGNGGLWPSDHAALAAKLKFK
jgi:hypothetical protein